MLGNRPVTELPSRAQVVVIGAGIVGNCLVGHLSRLGWTDMVLLDKGPLPNPGGSTGHASNFIFPTDHNKEMALLTLSTVQSIVWQTLRMTTDPKTIRQSIESRLFALSRSHDLLTREKWESAGLLDIAHDALEPFGVSGGRADRIVITGENIRCPPKAALALSIAFNELATNAMKYGAFSNAAGSIRIEWTTEAAPAGKRLLLSWTEKDGPPVKPPAHRGFGSRVLERGLAHELEGTVHLDYRPDGLVCTMDIPLPRGTRDG